MLLKFLLVITLISFVSAKEKSKNKFSRHYELDSYTFDDYLLESGKVYKNSDEYKLRKEIFMENFKIIQQHNSQKKSWKAGINQFTDQTKSELKMNYGADKRALHLKTKNSTSIKSRFSDVTLPASVDWRNVPNVVSPVKDQGKCGSCWAFAASATIESHVAINTGIMNEVSMQELVSCMPNSHSCGGTGGCEGATAELAFDYLAEYGLAELWSWGYGHDTYWFSYTQSNGACLRDETFINGDVAVSAAPRIVKGDGYELLTRNDYDELMTGLAHIGPMAVNVDASTWHLYESGVFTGCAQDNVDINHVVVAVGYGTDVEHGDYWLVRNSWTSNYGELGYIKVARERDYCGTDYHNGNGIGCDYDAESVTVCGMCGILYDSSYPTNARQA